jgi:predicted DNA-binding transcriptional regulator YafY
VPPVARAYTNRTEDVDEVFRAVAELRVLRFRYRAEPGSRDPGHGAEGSLERITSHPYALVAHGGSLVCLACPRGGSVAVFALDRMTEIEASETERYELPDEFAVNEWLHGDFGVARAPRTVKLLVEFDARVADAVRARRVHPSQKVAVAHDGRVRASFVLPDCASMADRVRSWLLGFGAAARVLEPRELAEDIARELRQAAARYSAEP